MNMREYVLDALRRQVRHEAIRLSSGTTSDWYIDCRHVTMHAAYMLPIGMLVLDALSDQADIQAVGGLTFGADPIAAATAMRSSFWLHDISMFSVRKAPKEHGTHRLIEGPFPILSNSQSELAAGAPVAIVDDVLTTGASVLAACRAVEAVGARVVRIVVLVDRQEGGKKVLQSLGYSVRAIFTKKDLLV